MEKAEIEYAINEYSDMLYRLAVMRTGNLTEAQDVVQQTFLKLVESYSKLKSQEHVKAWLIRVCLNICSNLYKSPWKRNVQTIQTTKEDAQLEQMCVASQEDVIIMRWQSEALWREIMQLPVKYRVVLHLRYAEEYSTKEIASLLHISSNTVCVRLSRAKQMLRTKLDKEEYEYE